MKILQKKKNSKFNSGLFFKIYFFFSIILIIFVSVIFINTGPWIQSKDKFLNRVYFNGLDNYLKIHKIFFKSINGFFINNQEISLSISHEEVLKLESDRKILIQNTKNGFRPKDFVFNEIQGVLNYNENKYEIKIRIKGDRDTHFKDRKNSSYKIDILRDKTFNGLRKFSLMKPRARNYVYEWIYHELIGEEQLIKLKYKFIRLKINGESQGIYVIEETPDKNLVERNKRRNGPIFSLKEEYSDNIFDGNLELYNKNYWSKKENINLTSSAKEKMKMFLNGNRNIEETFDLEKWAWLFAVSDLTYTYHGLLPYNVKFYYNPLSGLFEPIAYDGHRSARNYNKKLINYDERTSFDRANECVISSCIENSLEYWLHKFFFYEKNTLNRSFYEKYLKKVKKISNSIFLESFISKKKNKIDQINSLIYSDYFFIDNVSYGKYGPGLYFFSYDDLVYRAKVLNKKFSPELNKISLKDNGKKLIIKNNKELNNSSLIMTEVFCEKIKQNSILQKNFSTNVALSFSAEKIFEKNLEELTKCNYAKFIDHQTNKIFFKEIEFEKKNLEFKYLNKDFYKEFFKIEDNNLYLKENFTLIDKDLFIPGGYSVIINSGQSIKLINSAFVISDSAWIVDGSKGQVSIGGNMQNFGGGIIIKNSDKLSEFNNVEFKFLSGTGKRFIYDQILEKSYLIVTKYDNSKSNSYLQYKKKYNSDNFVYSDDYNYFGALNFYNTEVNIQNCKFSKIYAEDALNIISSEFKIHGSDFKEINSDAIDIDFSFGIISDLNFNIIGNDGIDFSGSDVKVNNILFNKTGDKGISVGEESLISIDNIQANNLFIGIASKDGSITKVKNISFNKVKIPFAAYQKKSSYAYGHLEIDGNINISEFIVQGLRDKNSSLIIDSTNLQDFTKNIIPIIYKKKIEYLF